MLWQRVATAVAILIVLIPSVLAAPVWPVAVLALVAVGLAGWEWARLNHTPGAGAVVLGALLGMVAAVALGLDATQHVPAGAWWTWLAVWVVGGGVALRRGVHAWPRLPRVLRLALGGVVLVMAWFALARSKSIGVNFLLSVLCLVWVADIAAYFGGRAFGRHKLAPSISPGKTWEGVLSGMVAVLVLAGAWLALDRQGWGDAPSFYSRVHALWGWPGLAASVLFLAGMSVVGDLFESLVKRSAGAKDSGALLPGHGGVLDRIDALLPVLPLALALSAGLP